MQYSFFIRGFANNPLSYFSICSILIVAMDEIRNGSEKIKILPMKEERKVLLKDVNNFFICRLCGGYLIDATGLIECFHTCKCLRIITKVEFKPNFYVVTF